MNSDLSGKKLLIIGANSETVPLVETANQMGVLTYVTSNRPNDVAKKYAYKACDVNGMDVDELVNLINNEHIDGVIVGVADFLVPFYYEVCKRKNFPCYASLEAIRCLGNKIEFKKNTIKRGC